MTTQPTRSPSATSPVWQRSWSYSSRGASSSSTSRRRGDLLKELPLHLHYAVGLVNIDLAIAILVGLVDHVLALLHHRQPLYLPPFPRPSLSPTVSCRCCCCLLLVSCCSMLHLLPPPPSWLLLLLLDTKYPRNYTLALRNCKCRMCQTGVFQHQLPAFSE